MELRTVKADIIQQLQKEILSLQGYGSVSERQQLYTGLGSIERAFPGHTFPIGAVHEFLSLAQEDAAATNGFIAGLLSSFMKSQGVCLWISTKRTLFPPALKLFGIEPERIIFVDLIREKEALWAIEEALKCKALAAVVGELSEISFTASRRLQLAVEQSRVTGFIHRYNPKSEHALATVSRWKITPMASIMEDDMPGIGFPRWNVRLLKVRNGKPGTWLIEWAADGFRHIPAFTPVVSGRNIRKTGTYA
jgi:protein ImuA